MKKLSVLFVLISGTCWAGMTVFVRMLKDLGLSTLDIVLVRCAMTSLLLFLLLLFTDRKQLKVKETLNFFERLLVFESKIWVVEDM